MAVRQLLHKEELFFFTLLHTLNYRGVFKFGFPMLALALYFKFVASGSADIKKDLGTVGTATPISETISTLQSMNSFSDLDR